MKETPMPIDPATEVFDEVEFRKNFPGPTAPAPIRIFETGATRDTDAGKLDFEGFLSPAVLRRFAEYMNRHRIQADGQLRASDNWQRGIPRQQYIKSAWRHFFDWWCLHRGAEAVTHPGGSYPTIEESLCGVLFNAMGYLHEHLKATDAEPSTQGNER